MIKRSFEEDLGLQKNDRENLTKMNQDIWKCHMRWCCVSEQSICTVLN
jgi:hypothetical protein